MRQLLFLLLSFMLVSTSLAATQSKDKEAQKNSKQKLDHLLQKKTKNGQSVHLSFVQTASLARLTQNQNNSSLYKLVLYDVSPYITYYTGRPGQLTGLALVNNFVKAWKVGSNSFASQPPNAVLSASEINGQSSDKFYVVKLLKIGYSQQHNAMAYEVKPLQGQNLVLSDLKMKNFVMVVN